MLELASSARNGLCFCPASSVLQALPNDVGLTLDSAMYGTFLVNYLTSSLDGATNNDFVQHRGASD